MAGDEHARDMYRFIYEGVADEWSEVVKLHRAAIRARIGEIDEAAANGGIADWLFGMFGSGKGKKAEREKEMQKDPSELAEKYPMPQKHELALEEGNGETAKRLLALLASGERSRSELAAELTLFGSFYALRARLLALSRQNSPRDLLRPC